MRGGRLDLELDAKQYASSLVEVGLKTITDPRRGQHSDTLPKNDIRSFTRDRFHVLSYSRSLFAVQMNGDIGWPRTRKIDSEESLF